jgi:hypothetical protein
MHMQCDMHGGMPRCTIYGQALIHFTFTLMCIVIYLFLNNQPDALIIQIYSVIKLYMFRASSLPIIRSFLLLCSSILTLLGRGHQKPA